MLVNIKNNDQKCFLGCHIRHINPLKEHPERITKIDREIASNLYKKKIMKRLKYKTIFVLMCFVMKMRWFFQIMFLIKNLKTRH